MRSLLLAALLASCYHDTTPTLANGVGGGSTDPLAYLPIDSEFVLGADVQALRASAMWKRFEPRIRAEMGHDYDEVRAACGFDPAETMTYFAIGLRFTDEDHPSGVAVVRGMPAKALECVATRFGKGGEATRDRGTVVLHEGRTNLAWTMVGDTLLLHIDPAAGHDSLERIVASGAPLHDSPAFMALYDHLDHHAAVFGAGNGASQALRFLGTIRPMTVSGTMAISDRLDWITHVKMPTAGAAKVARDELQNDIDKAKPFVNTLDMTGKDDAFDVHVVVDSDKLDALMTLARIK